MFAGRKNSSVPMVPVLFNVMHGECGVNAANSTIQNSTIQPFPVTDTVILVVVINLMIIQSSKLIVSISDEI